MSPCQTSQLTPPDRLQAFTIAGRDKAEVPPFGYAACTAAYGDASAESWRQRLVAYIRANRDHAEHSLLSMGLRCTRPEASYLTWIDASTLGVRSPMQHFLRHGVAFTDGTHFGDSSCVRLNLGTKLSILQSGLQCTQAAVDAAAATRSDASSKRA